MAAQRTISLRSLAGEKLPQLPYVLRILLENVARHLGEGEQTSAILAWLDRRSSAQEIPFQPARLLMHDTTCGPALADIAGMRHSLAEAGGTPWALNPQIPIDVSVDHSIAVDHFGSSAAIKANMKREQERNEERFRFMKWAQANLTNLRIHPPGTGIMHTINLEQLASVVTTRDGWTFPDTLIGTDSHTPMINGLGVLAWGVGGLEAEGVMFGLPVMMRIPDVIGVRLEGALPEGTFATDLALHVTHQFRARGIDNPFVEFHGPGVSGLTVGQRAVVANMAPEMGAQTAYFPIDDQTLAYLKATGRSADQVALVRDYAQASGLWFDPLSSPSYTDTFTIDLSTVATSLAGPQRPQDLIAPAEARQSIEPLVAKARHSGRKSQPGRIEDGAVAIAAITSCTNTSDARLNIAAGLLARRARAFGLAPKPWVKTSFSPGSPAAARYLERAGLIEDLDAVGFGIVGFGCMTCIGNSGPLLDTVETAIREEGIVPVAVLSGNRNFPGRVHPLLSAGFLASPPLVIAYSLAGTIDIDIQNDPLGQTPDGKNVYLRDLWPSAAEIEAIYHAASSIADFPQAFAVATQSRLWREVETVKGELWPFDPASTYLRRPPFANFAEPQFLDRLITRPLLVLGDDITTDQISPAGAVPADSEVGRYLVERGENPKDLNVFSSRRGNFEVMVRGLFTNRTVENHLAPGIAPGFGVDFETGEHLPLHILARRNRERGVAGVILAGERYGAGSSRDWAAKGTALIGARAVIASSFERIHRTNLIGMGVLPLKAPQGLVPSKLGIGPTDTIEIALLDPTLAKRSRFAVTIHYAGREPETFAAIAQIETELEISLLHKGGIIPFILSGALDRSASGGKKVDLH
ncbi:aconitate hydratase AcnA [Pelagibacterium sp. 26DY04]|uniref:aconitate hydratase AcnA n=1 Tax=Pelagibacterium sp. 26DY04 TaxID=2967130 RepID=UPI00281610D9|nr:aconitate hydratase AcnA [Pelagibacterium sp. 26DY04]WMT86859.1 aconitate hydratase AcnA [Pelagibacterium sp. 26DY04]